ncbi:hypothetical protein LOS88_09435 [Aeromonas veronii]|uniref:hypothetical protein n=1 Tax=Aeromonas veronii TaxID=654 RepID=UPI001FD35F2C|nr:hypothetical protein [Aeromonas veronii]MCJ7976729.1 hypothetical protein [Aeromonas veronii]UOR20834.1 hypothetical protein LOS88_09435 [Aeromonas veronii]
MKRYNCTLSDKRGAFGDCMEAHSTGRYVLFSDVERLRQRMQDLLDKSNRTGLAIERAISTGSVLADHPLQSRLELLANHHKRELMLAELLRRARRYVSPLSCPESEIQIVQSIVSSIDSVLAGQTIGRTLTEDQEFELTTVLQSIANGFSDDPAHDAAALLKRIAGEVPWTGDSFQLPPRQAGLLCNEQHSLAGQVFAGLSAATALSVLDANSAADVVQLMLEAAEATGGEPCDFASPSSSPA